jgi:hypothetical protein
MMAELVTDIFYRISKKPPEKNARGKAKRKRGVLRFLESSLLVTGTGCQVKIEFETNGILAQKN